MNNGALHAWYAAGSIAAIYGVAYLGTALSAPAFFRRHLSIERENRFSSFLPRPRTGRWGERVRLGLALVAVAYFLFRASEPLVDFVPFSWGWHDEDGGWFALRDTLRIFITLFATIWALTGAEKAGKRGLVTVDVTARASGPHTG